MQITINEALSMKKALSDRRKELAELLKETAVNKTEPWADTKSKQSPAYDVRSVDSLNLDLQLALYTIDAAIKTSNAKTSVEIDVDFKILMRPLEGAK